MRSNFRLKPFSMAVTAFLFLVTSCGGSGSEDANTNELGSVVVWVKMNGTGGGALWGKSLVGDLATTQETELFPASTRKRMSPNLSKVDTDNSNEVALYWMEQPGNNSVIHRYVFNDVQDFGEEIVVNDSGAFASGPAADEPRMIWYSSNVSGDSEIYYQINGGTPKQLTNQVGNDSAPDSNHLKVIFQSTRSGNFDIFEMDSTTGTEVKNLTNNPAADINARYSPDGSKIVFASNRTGRYNIYMMNRDGSGLVRLTTHTADDATPCFSADGKYVVFASKLDGDWDIYALDLVTKVETNLTNDNIDDRAPHCGKYKSLN